MRKRKKSKFKQWLSRAVMILLLFAGLSVLSKIFGENSEITSFYEDQILFTPYNIVGMIMIPLAPFGIWVGKKNGKKLFATVSKALTAMSILPWIANVLSWARIQEYSDPKLERRATMFRIIALIAWIVLIIIFVCFVIKRIKTSIEKREKSENKEIITEKIDIHDNFLPKTPETLETTIKSNDKNLLLKKVSENEVLVQDDKKEDAYVEEKTFSAQQHIQQEELIILADDTVDENFESVPYSYDLHQIAKRICPECGGRLKSRQNRETKEWFMGCQNYFSSIKCTFTIDYRDFKEIEREFL